MSDYEPGTVAMVAYDGNPERLMLRVIYRDTTELAWVDKDYKILDRHDRVQSVRPLVTLDLSKRDAADLALWLRKQIRGAGSVAERVADQIEAQTRPPKPAEPQGLGAVVEDTEGVLWVRSSLDGEDNLGKPWKNGPVCKHWQIVDAVRVLSEGVQP